MTGYRDIEAVTLGVKANANVINRLAPQLSDAIAARDAGIRTLRAWGWSYGRIAEVAGISRARVAKIAPKEDHDLGG